MSAIPHRPIALLSPLVEERDALLHRLTEIGTHAIGTLQVTTGKLEGHSVALAESGVGKVASTAIATLIATSLDCRAIVVCGVAGGIDPELAIGDVVIADRLIQHDYGHLTNQGIRNFRPGIAPIGEARDRIAFDLSAELLMRIGGAVKAVALPPLPPDLGIAVQRPPRIAFGPIVSGDQFINSELVRARLHRDYAALAVEMEGAAVAQAAELLGIPCIVIRSLSDLAGAESHLDFPKFLRAVAPAAAEVVARIVSVL
ncbi:MAG TPA: 5'-methylthioadenosine/adenosylhomocysteine nucleosidase [Dongiaceae bacterium]|jgi:adenosylhomocysteine nucleosidase|nr:5'-methylthioadenosine/adenosylhomocysteine nucleosidase [Dongiaceae bacterium]